MTRFAPVFVLVLVTAILLGYGSHPWSWFAGPLAALAVWIFGLNARTPAGPEPAPVRRRTPAPVD